MKRVLTTELAAHAGQRVLLQGWLHRRRELSRVSFLVLRDRAGLAQVVVEQAPELLPETVLEIEGVAVANEQAPGGVEVHEPQIRVLAEPADAPPVELHRPEPRESLPVRLDAAPVALRHPAVRERFRLAARAVAAFRSTLDARGFTEIQTPKIVATATEGGANLFRIDYFGRDAFLAQSPQFYKQTMVGVFERVYEVGPVFRAEPHDTARHLAQYTSLDAELGFITDHRDVMAVLAVTLAGMAAAVAPWVALEVPAEIPAVHFTEALRIAAAPDDEPDLAPAHERALGEWARREHGSDFVFVTGYPMRKRPFYTHPDPANPAYSNGFDLLFRGVELVTGGQRLHRYDDYAAALAAAGEPLEPYQGYLDGFRYGMPPHGGFAIGLERFV
ncbi:MAG: aspartate--tRNA(Asn) ligase, partial [Gaiellaceae bacterium]